MFYLLFLNDLVGQDLVSILHRTLVHIIIYCAGTRIRTWVGLRRWFYRPFRLSTPASQQTINFFNSLPPLYDFNCLSLISASLFVSKACEYTNA